MRKLLLTLLALFLIELAEAQSWSMTWGEPDQFTQFFSIHFPTAETGYIIGNSTPNPQNPVFENGRIFKSTDGGNSFSMMYGSWPPPPTLPPLWSLHFVDADYGFAVGNAGILLKTINGGDTWTTLNSGFSGNLRKVYFVDQNNGFILTEDYTWIRTVDGGDNWSEPLTFNGTLIRGYDMDFPTTSTGYICMIDTLYKTTDGGDNWDKILLSGIFLADISFPNNTVGYGIARHPSSTSLFKTMDGGHTWNYLEATIMPMDFWYRAILFLNEDTGYVIKQDTIMVTANGGMNWYASQHFSGLVFLLSFPNEMTGYAGVIFNDGDNHTLSYVYKTTNGGGVNVGEAILPATALRLIPNPAKDVLLVKLEGAQGGYCNLSICNLAGQNLLFTRFTGETRIDVSGFKPGVYIVKAETREKALSGKLIIE